MSEKRPSRKCRPFSGKRATPATFGTSVTDNEPSHSKELIQASPRQPSIYLQDRVGLRLFGSRCRAVITPLPPGFACRTTHWHRTADSTPTTQRIRMPLPADVGYSI